LKVTVTQVYKKRFGELNDQMETLFASKAPTYSGLPKKTQIEINGNNLLEWRVKVRNLLSKACGSDSEHYKEFSENERTGLYGTHLETLERLRAVFLAAKEDYEGGYLQSTRSLIQAEVFDSELEQGRALLESGYKSSAAVVSGVVLETALRELCDRQGIPHGKLDKMNADLAKSGEYNKLQQKRITALADIRNSAAHGHPEDFSERDVEDMIRDVERLVAEHL